MIKRLILILFLLCFTCPAYSQTNLITDGTFDDTTAGSDLFEPGASGETLGAEQSSGALTVGKWYKITAHDDADFTLAGASASTVGTYFNCNATGGITLDAGDKVKEVTANARGQFSAPTAGSSELITTQNNRDFSSGTIENWVPLSDGENCTVTYDANDLGGVDDKQGMLSVIDGADPAAYMYATIASTYAAPSASTLYMFQAKIMVPAGNTLKTVAIRPRGSTSFVGSIYSTPVPSNMTLTGNAWTLCICYGWIASDNSGEWLIGFEGNPANGDLLYFDDISIKKVNLSWTPYGTNKISVVEDSENWALKTEWVDTATGALLSLANAGDFTADYVAGCQYKVVENAKCDTSDTSQLTIANGVDTITTGNLTTSYVDYTTYLNAKSALSLAMAGMGAGEYTLVNTATVQPVTLDSWVEGAGWGAYATGGAQSAKAYCYNAAGALEHTWTPTVSHFYRVTYTIGGYSAGTMTPSLGGVTLTARTADGTYTEDIKATATTTLKFTGTVLTCTLDDVIVYDVTSVYVNGLGMGLQLN